MSSIQVKEIFKGQIFLMCVLTSDTPHPPGASSTCLCGPYHDNAPELALKNAVDKISSSVNSSSSSLLSISLRHALLHPLTNSVPKFSISFWYSWKIFVRLFLCVCFLVLFDNRFLCSQVYHFFQCFCLFPRHHLATPDVDTPNACRILPLLLCWPLHP